jgi:DNA invertase Pin-like site-specific DNA recombinase
MKIALYARVSRRTGTQDTENQLVQLREFARVQGWNVVHEYVDRATGKHSDREQFQKMFRDASQRKFDLVLFLVARQIQPRGRFGDAQSLAATVSRGRGLQEFFTEQYLDSCGIFKDAVVSILARSQGRSAFG